MTKPATYPASSTQSVWLYRTVFANRITRGFLLVILVVLFSQPLSLVYANEETGQPDSAAEETETEALSETLIPASEEDEEVEAVVLEPEENDTQVEIVDETTSGANVATDTSETAEAVEPEVVVAEASTTVEAVVGTTSPTTTTDIADEEVAGAASSSVAEVTLTASGTPSHTDTDSTDGVVETAISSVPLEYSANTNANHFKFSKDDCIRVADGSYYCGASDAVVPQTDSFYVALDTDGDREIFALQDGETYQITENHQDDAAPYYDAKSETLVWHRLIDGRYQIMTYDFDAEEEVQLTDGRTNNMEPTRYGNHVAWQQWSNDGWEIVVSDGATTSVLTHNSVPDIAPSVSDGYIVWKRVYEAEQEVVIYDLKSQTEVRVNDASMGATVQQARMLLVYEGVTPEGDRVVRGFDPVTQEVVPLESLPGDVPDNLPDSDPTDEIRALVQPKPTQEEDEVADVVQNTATSSAGASATATSSQSATASSTSVSEANASAATTSEPMKADLTLDLSTTTPVAAVEPALASSSDSSYDLVIPPPATSTEQ